ncbi:NAD-dependent succinate-semialdehyde dehydrogenase [Sphingomonas ginkgonis]|uniref:NAD-dependent succinate-semialdehyde dehydrogenase n=1 Tax=Sphingomonas ginkgonis TaxID=2315330 RepID=A0A429V7B5_9SPHN|nr:NAD-dependent succinate-semialdehyde dehydrogenase [Sphingomonas ginkgonis]RST29825.1 NAD-dependent succinate-semialdehyde dehydrogenase [Sphingomonas ginkgonis]
MFRSTNPATGAEIATYPELTAAEVETKVARAAACYRQWRNSAVEERTALLERIAERFDSDRERLARMATDEMGKTLAGARAEVEKCAAGFRHAAQEGAKWIAPQPLPGGSGELHYRPLGPILAVMPWNFPYWQAVRFLSVTILAGNVGLLKHASIVQGCAGLLEEAVTAAGAPAGLFQNLAIRSGSVAGLIADDRIAAVTLTGSEAAGRSVAIEAGKALKKVVLELGGSDPFIVMPSAHLDKAVATAVTARVQNAGQSCVCGKRMIVHADIYDDFAERFTKAMLELPIGDPTEDSIVMGPLSSEEQRNTVLDQLDEAKSSGATLTGGTRLDRPGAWMSAGVLTDVPVDSHLMQEEIFGPVAMLFRAHDIDEAIEIANATPYGLGGAVFTNDAGEQARFVADVESGMLAVNQLFSSIPEAPFGGIKHSGHGRELGPWGAREFMNVKTVLRASQSAPGTD